MGVEKETPHPLSLRTPEGRVAISLSKLQIASLIATPACDPIEASFRKSSNEYSAYVVFRQSFRRIEASGFTPLRGSRSRKYCQMRMGATYR